jgi:hypothetical protein
LGLKEKKFELWLPARPAQGRAWTLKYGFRNDSFYVLRNIKCPQRNPVPGNAFVFFVVVVVSE